MQITISFEVNVVDLLEGHEVTMPQVYLEEKVSPDQALVNIIQYLLYDWGNGPMLAGDFCVVKTESDNA